MNTFDNGTIYSARCAVHGLHPEAVTLAFCAPCPAPCALRPVLCALCPAPRALRPVTMQINKIRIRINNFLFINLQVISCLKQ